jgi:hypothetical protein
MAIRTLVRPVAAAVGVFGLLGLLGACGSSSKTSSPPTSGSSTSGSVASNPQLCSARDALKQSIQDLGNLNVIQNGTSGLDAAVNKVRDNLQAVKSASHEQLQPQVTAVQNALDQLGKSISNLSSGGSINDVVNAARNVGQTGSNLADALSSLKCS